MNSRSLLLAVDGVANLLLGVVLLGFPASFFETLGLLWPGRGLYPAILGGVLIGIGVALLLENWRGASGPVGLGLAGAVAINLAAALAISGWLLLSGAEGTSSAGRAVLWLLVPFLLGLGALEISAHRRGPVSSQ